MVSLELIYLVVYVIIYYRGMGLDEKFSRMCGLEGGAYVS